MLSLNSPRWNELSHAYGNAGNIPAVLEQLKTAPPMAEPDSEPWFSLWSSLCHQYDVYTASYAALPHVIAIGASRPPGERLDHLYLAASIEGFRHLDDAPAMPEFLSEAYQEGIEQGAELCLDCLKLEWQEEKFQILLGALTVFKGHPQLGNALFELSEETECPNCQTYFPTRGFDLFASK